MSLILQNVIFSYDSEDRNAVNGVDLEVKEGEVVTVLGHNGSGKSTLAKLCNGLLVPSSGTVTVDGYSTANEKDVFEVRKRVGVVFQNPDNQMVASVIEDDVAFGPENLALDPDEIRKRVDHALEAVGMSEYATHTPFKLSGGQKQRIAIAGVLALKPKYMIMDESTAMLDPLSRREIMKVVMKVVREEKMALINITHFTEEAMESDKIIVLSDGKIALEGKQEIFEESEKLKSVGLVPPIAVRVRDELVKNGKDIPLCVTDEDLVKFLSK